MLYTENALNRIITSGLFIRCKSFTSRYDGIRPPLKYMVNMNIPMNTLWPIRSLRDSENAAIVVTSTFTIVPGIT